jgi:hypothetical protein
MVMGNLNKSKETMQMDTTALKVHPRGPLSTKVKIPLLDQNLILKVPLNVKIVQQDLFHRKFLKNL